MSEYLPADNGRADVWDEALAVAVKYLHNDGSITAMEPAGNLVLPADSKRAEVYAKAKAQTNKYLYPDGSIYDMEAPIGGGDPGNDGESIPEVYVFDYEPTQGEIDALPDNSMILKYSSGVSKTAVTEIIVKDTTHPEGRSVVGTDSTATIELTSYALSSQLDPIVQNIYNVNTKTNANATNILTKVSKNGDTLTGALITSRDPLENMEVANRQYVQALTSQAASGRSTLKGHYYGKTDPTSTMPAPNDINPAMALKLDYFDFTTNTIYDAASDGSAWIAGQVIVPTDGATMPITIAFGDITPPLPGNAVYSSVDSTWTYLPSPQRVLDLTQFYTDIDGVTHIADGAIKDAQVSADANISSNKFISDHVMASASTSQYSINMTRYNDGRQEAWGSASNVGNDGLVISFPPGYSFTVTELGEGDFSVIAMASTEPDEGVGNNWNRSAKASNKTATSFTLRANVFGAGIVVGFPVADTDAVYDFQIKGRWQ